MNWVAVLNVLGSAFFLVAFIEGVSQLELGKEGFRARAIRGWIAFFLATLFFALAAGMGIK